MSESRFPDRVKALRIERNMTQREFSKLIGITAATLSAYESGEKSPSLATIERIANEYGVSLDWLCGIETKRSVAKTRGDVARLLCELFGTGYFDFGGRVVREHGDAVYELTHLEAIIDDGVNSKAFWISKFLDDLRQMHTLKCKEIVSEDIYATWLDSNIEKMDNLPLDTECIS